MSAGLSEARIKSLASEIDSLVAENEEQRRRRKMSRRAEMAEFRRETESFLAGSRHARQLRQNGTSDGNSVMNANVQRREFYIRFFFFFCFLSLFFFFNLVS